MPGSGVQPWIPVIGSVAGAAIDAWSQNQTNKANAKNVQDQIAFQDQQSKTSYQRAVDDLKAAGLNPALAYQNGGNSNMPGAAARVDPVISGTAQRFASAVDIYNQLATGSAQRNLINAQATAADASARYTAAQSQVIAPDVKLGEDPDYYKTYRDSRIARNSLDVQTTSNYPNLFRAQIGQIGSATAQAQAAAREAQSRTTLNEQMFQNEWFRKNLSPYINSTAKTLGIFKDVNNLSLPR